MFGSSGNNLTENRIKVEILAFSHLWMRIQLLSPTMYHQDILVSSFSQAI
jgi:hypothetical protein